MSSNEASSEGSKAFEFDEAELAAFEATGFEGAAKLREARHFGKVAFDRGPYNEPTVTQKFMTSSGEDVSAIFSAFTDWQTKTKSSRKKNEEYLKAVSERPGRAATILTPMSGPESKTILGAPISDGKSVL